MTGLNSDQGRPAAYPTMSSVARYNTMFPGAELPSNMRALEGMRRFDAGGIGIEDDLVGSGSLLTIDFLPGGAPQSLESDRVGVVVATHWGQPPIRVLASDVSLWLAWLALTRAWPTRLSVAAEALAELRRYPGSSRSDSL